LCVCVLRGLGIVRWIQLFKCSEYWGIPSYITYHHFPRYDLLS
jgi:hypothetical protein